MLLRGKVRLLCVRAYQQFEAHLSSLDSSSFLHVLNIIKITFQHKNTYDKRPTQFFFDMIYIGFIDRYGLFFIL